MSRVPLLVKATGAAFLALLAGMAHAAPAAAPAAGPTPPAGEIIPLPLNPVVPPSQRICARTLPSGLGYTALRPTAGAQPAASDIVLVSYLGYLAATGVVFDQAQGVPFALDGVIPGMSEGVRQMAKGAVSRICIPAALGYGAQASGPIPANADLVFQVELVDFKTRAEVEAMRAAQTDAAPPVAERAPVPGGK